MILFIKRNVYAARMNDLTFFLSLTDNQYYSAQFDFMRNFSQKMTALWVEEGSMDASVACALLKKDLLTEDEALANKEPFYEGPQAKRQLACLNGAFNATSLSLKFILQFYRAIRHASVKLSKLTLGALRDKLSKKRENNSLYTNDLKRIFSLVSSYDSLRPFYWKQKTCLLDSVALLYLLSAYNFSSDLIVGVKDEPFEAHCWLQVDDVVLNDSIEKVAAFSPILRL
ncbi:MAG: lasso peptide biosynthesis B2 protein [Holosporales bacterium]